jgi:hypothetical protein
MRLNPLHLRIALLVLNLAAAVGVPAYAAMSYWKTGDNVGTLVIAEPGDLVFREGEADGMVGKGPSQLIAVAGWVMPSRPVAETPGSGDLTTDASTVPKPPSDSKELLPGPLADEHHLEYVFAIVRKEEPTRNFVILRKKDDAAANPAGPGAGATASARTNVRRTTTNPQRPARVTVGGRKPGVGQPSDAVSFFVSKRWYMDKDRGLDFMIHSADEKQFVYWMPSDPKKMYALPKVTDSLYYRDREAGLRPAEKSPDDLAQAEEQMKHFIFHDRKDVEIGTEEEYQEMLQGKPRGPLLSPKKSASEGEKAPAPSSPGGSPGKAVPKFGGKAEPRTVMTDEEKQQLREALKSPKMSTKDREELQKALMGAPGVK